MNPTNELPYTEEPTGVTNLAVYGELLTKFSPEAYKAHGDGIHDDRASLAIMDAAGPGTGWPGKTYLINSNLTLTNGWRPNRSIIDGPAGASPKPVLTINGPLAADSDQCFGSNVTVVFGAGAVHSLKPEWWGAVADNTTDSGVAINAATAAALAMGGGTVELGTGTYASSIPIVLGNGVRLRGVSWRLSCLRVTANNVNAIEAIGTALALRVQVTVEHLKIQGPGQASGSTGHGIKVSYGAPAILLRDLWVVSHGANGIDFDHTYCATLSDLVLDSNGGYGFNAATSANNIIWLRCNAINNTLGGYKVLSGATGQFIACDAEMNGGSGFDIRYTYDYALRGCHLERNGTDGTSAQIYLASATGAGDPCNTTTLDGCFMNGSAVSDTGIYLDYANQTNIRNCFVTGHKTQDLTVSAHATRTLLGQNNFQKAVNNLSASLRYQSESMEGKATLTWAAINGGATADKTITVTGATLTTNPDRVVVQPASTLPAGLMFCAWISAVNTVTVRILNTTASPITPTTEEWRATVIRDRTTA